MLVRTTPDQLESLAAPGRCQMGEDKVDHYVVLTRVSGDKIVIVDRTTGDSYSLLRSTFASRWSGRLLPGPSSKAPACLGSLAVAVAVAGIITLATWNRRCSWFGPPPPPPGADFGREHICSRALPSALGGVPREKWTDACRRRSAWVPTAARSL